MADMTDTPTIWIFNGARSTFPSGVFSTKIGAEQWILARKLTGTLTRYPVDTGVYEWALERNYFTPSKDEQRTPEFIGKFSCASQEHYHYEDGVLG